MEGTTLVAFPDVDEVLALGFTVIDRGGHRVIIGSDGQETGVSLVGVLPVIKALGGMTPARAAGVATGGLPKEVKVS